MTETVRAGFAEHEAEARVQGMPLSHLSVEVGHLYTEDYRNGDRTLLDYFSRVAGWLEAVTVTAKAQLAPVRPRISTCFMFDDHYGSLPSPTEIIPRVLDLADRAGLRIDYLARESGCVRDGDLEIASLVAARLVDEPPPGTTGARPPTSVTGWLSNGQRTPMSKGPAMSVPAQWQPPKENIDSPHSVFLDVELWDLVDGRRRYSCPFLASVWQLLRLGLLRDGGAVIASPQPVPRRLPERWTDLPVIMRTGDRPAAFAAFRTTSIMDSKFLKVEQAVRTILGAVATQSAVNRQLNDRAERERLRLPAQVVDRAEYVFLGPSWRETE